MFTRTITLVNAKETSILHSQFSIPVYIETRKVKSIATEIRYPRRDERLCCIFVPTLYNTHKRTHTYIHTHANAPARTQRTGISRTSARVREMHEESLNALPSHTRLN